MAIWHGMPWDDGILEKDLNGVWFSTQSILNRIKLTKYKHVWYQFRVPFNDTNNGIIYFKQNYKIRKLVCPY